LTVNVAGYSGGIFVKCLGESTYRSYFETRQRLFQLLARHDPTNTRFVIQAALFDAVSSGKDANSVVAAIKVEPRAYHGTMDTCETNLQLIEFDRDNGAFIFPEEEVLMHLSKKVLNRVLDEAKRQARTALANEDTAFSRPATRQEQEMATSVTGVGQMAQAMAGVELDYKMSPQLITLNRQANTSREWLRKAHAWEFNMGDQGEPSFVRAETRGDTLLARANDKTQNLSLRDKLYENAEQYYEQCNCDDKATKAKTAHDAIRPTLQARQERQRQQLEKTRTDMQRKVEGMKEATDSMKKSDAEKKKFNEEADELEKELGF